jgi:Tfp pilus assembly protein PilF
MIAKAAGDKDAAGKYLAKALELNPEFHPRQAAEARAALKELTK